MLDRIVVPCTLAWPPGGHPSRSRLRAPGIYFARQKGRIYFRSQRSGEISAKCLPITGKLLPGRNQVGKLPVDESISLWGADDSAGRTWFFPLRLVAETARPSSSI